MSNIRSWYLFLVSAISLQSVVWAAIALLRGIFHTNLRSDFDSVTGTISVIIVGLPIFLWHWSRARDHIIDPEVDGDVDISPGAIYFYLMLLGFVYPIVANTNTILAAVMQQFLGLDKCCRKYSITVSETMISAGIALFILCTILFYFYIQQKNAKYIDSVNQISFLYVRRIHLFVLSISGLLITIYSFLSLLNWILLDLFSTNNIIGLNSAASIIVDDSSRLLVGLVLWQLPWNYLQSLYINASHGEQESPLRKIYLYSLIFVSSLVVVATTATVFSVILSIWFGLENTGEIHIAINVFVVFGAVWLYHAMVLRSDAEFAVNKYSKAKIIRIYRYLLSAISFVALLIGLGGALDVIIRMMFMEEIGNAMREQIASVLATLFASLPVWLFSWQKIQRETQINNEMAQVERQSVVRKVYVYFFLFIATMTVLISGVTVLSELLNMLMGEGSYENIFDSFPYAISYSLIAFIVWFYHRAILKEDENSNIVNYKDSIENGIRILVFMPVDDNFAISLSSKLESEFPGTQIDLSHDITIIDSLTTSDVIIADASDSSIFATSLAHKFVIISSDHQGWYWIGVTYRSKYSQIRSCLHALKQLLSGEEVKPPRKSNGCMFAIAIPIGIYLLSIAVINILEM